MKNTRKFLFSLIVVVVAFWVGYQVAPVLGLFLFGMLMAWLLNSKAVVVLAIALTVPVAAPTVIAPVPKPAVLATVREVAAAEAAAVKLVLTGVHIYMVVPSAAMVKISVSVPEVTVGAVVSSVQELAAAETGTVITNMPAKIATVRMTLKILFVFFIDF